MYMGNVSPEGIIQHPNGSIENVIEELEASDLFIGIGSGLSWLSWMTQTPTILISGFSEPYTEPNTNVYKVNAPKEMCSGCFNKHRLDAGNWNWCPSDENKTEIFECSKYILSADVIKEINKILSL